MNSGFDFGKNSGFDFGMNPSFDGSISANIADNLLKILWRVAHDVGEWGFHYRHVIAMIRSSVSIRASAIGLFVIMVVACLVIST